MTRILKAPLLITDKGLTVEKSLKDLLTKAAVWTVIAATCAGVTACGSDEYAAPPEDESTYVKIAEAPQSLELFSQEDCMAQINEIRKQNPEAGCIPLTLKVDENSLSSAAAPTASASTPLNTLNAAETAALTNSAAPSTTPTHSSGMNPMFWYMMGRLNSPSNVNSFSARPAGYLNLDGKGVSSLTSAPKYPLQTPTQNALMSRIGGVNAFNNTAKVGGFKSSFNASRASVGSTSSGRAASYGGMGRSGVSGGG